jgi:hypothetical protein
LRRVEVLLQACAQALLGVQGGLRPSVVELSGLPRVALLAELALKRGALGAGVLAGDTRRGWGARLVLPVTRREGVRLADGVGVADPAVNPVDADLAAT